MFSITIALFIVVFILALIGLVRGPSRELGVTLALVVLLAFLSQVNTIMELNEMPARVGSAMARFGLSPTDPNRARMVVWFFYSSIVIMTAFLAYHGHDTLAYSLKGPTGCVGAVFGGFVGAVNGYLIGGSIWYYLDRLGYPVQQFDWLIPQFTPQAQQFVNLLPQNLAGPLILSAIALGMLWWRIAR